MKWIYVQAQIAGNVATGEEEIRFRHATVEAADQDDAYLAGQRLFPTMDADASMLNDYVILLAPAMRAAGRVA